MKFRSLEREIERIRRKMKTMNVSKKGLNENFIQLSWGGYIVFKTIFFKYSIQTCNLKYDGNANVDKELCILLERCGNIYCLILNRCIDLVMLFENYYFSQKLCFLIIIFLHGKCCSIITHFKKSKNSHPYYSGKQAIFAKNVYRSFT